jgi:iron complex outermembrane recepter protein
MQVRMTRRGWWSFAFASAVLIGSLLLGGANAQDKKDEQKDDKKLKTLPPTKVEATPTPPTLQAPVEASPPTGNPLSSGGVFGSPAVQGYRADSASSGTKVDSPLIDYPGTISVIPRDLIQDQQALSVDDILRDIPSAIKLSDSGIFRDSFLLRGFEVGSRDFRWNGFTDPTYINRDFYNVQRVEVLSGPASVLYGAGSPSGLINFITKQPLDTPYNNLQFTAGSFNLTRYAVDSTGPIDDDNRMLYRVNAVYQQADSFRDFGWSQRTAASPVFAFMIDPNTVLSFEGAYQDSRQHFDTGLIYYNGQIQGPINRSFNQPGDWQATDDYKSLISLVHKFNDNWTGRIQFFNDSYDTTGYGTSPDISSTNTFNQFAPAFGLPALGPNTILRDTQSFHLEEQFYDLRAELNGKFDGLLFKHNAVVGAELGWYHSYFNSVQSDPAPNFMPTSAFNFVNPVYSQGGNQPLLPALQARIAQERYGLYVSDMIELNEHWKVLVGARYDIVNTDFVNSGQFNFFGSTAGSFPAIINDRTDYYVSPRVALIYQPIPEMISFYGTYSQSFDPPITGAFTTPTALLPETGVTGEIGVKVDLFDKKLSIQAAGFIIDKHNVIAQENLVTSTAVGEIRSTGAEFSIVGNITREWSVIANYAYTDARIVGEGMAGDLGAVGNRFRGVPYNSGNIWSRYNVIDNDTQTLGVGLGVVMIGQRYGDLNDSFSLPGYTRFDAGVFYKRGRMNASLYLENLGNRTYYTGSFDATTIFPGAPFNVRFSVGITF